MADIFGNVQPPAWLTHMTQQEPGQLGRIVGELVGGLGLSAKDAIDKAHDKQSQGIDTNWIKELPGSINQGLTEARLNMLGPTAQIQAAQAQQNLVAQGLQMQNQMSLINARSQTLRMQQHDQEVLPQWMQEHPTWESRQDATPPTLLTPQGQKMFRDIQIGDAQNVRNKAQVSGVNSFAKSLAELEKVDPDAAGTIAGKWNGKVPTPQLQAELGAALGRAQVNKQVSQQPYIMTLKRDDGTEVTGVYTPKTGRFQEDKDAIAQIRAREQAKETATSRAAQIDIAKNKVKELFKDMHALENQQPDRQKALQAEYNKANDELTNLLNPKTQAAPAPATPKVGQVYKGYKFKGGDPSDKSNWEKQ